MKKAHTVHIPVMGTCFTIDSPIKVAKYGIDSVISLVDDTLIEQMRKFYCQKFGRQYQPITKDEDDHRAKRITSYLDLIDDVVKKQFQELKDSAFEMGTEITKYFDLLPETSPLKVLYKKMLSINDLGEKRKAQDKLRELIRPGSIDVNIMTKLDRPYFSKSGDPLPQEYSDALAALRGFAKSKVQAAIVFSAGINSRLYTYISEFKDFYADKAGGIKKRIVLKVSDYRSSLIQGKFFAKRGLWVSEFRIESGMNCGGHAFISPGRLMGPMLEEFKLKRDELITKLHQTFNLALQNKEKEPFPKPLPVKITAQGGIGTPQEDAFLMNHYDLDGTGWGTPFLLCDEAVSVDRPTMDRLSQAKEEDLYFSDSSPLGVPFNNLKTSFSEEKKRQRIADGKPGSPCPKGHLAFNTEFTEQPICTASHRYQEQKLAEIEKTEMSEDEKQAIRAKVMAKACICHDLGGGILIRNGIRDASSTFPAVCPGPNLAHFSKLTTLAEIMGHIYGRCNVLDNDLRPHMFITELHLYSDHLISTARASLASASKKQIQYFNEFKDNLLNGIDYYRELLPSITDLPGKNIDQILSELDHFQALILEAAAECFPSPEPAKSRCQ